jgi:hypothetical protein
MATVYVPSARVIIHEHSVTQRLRFPSSQPLALFVKSTSVPLTIRNERIVDLALTNGPGPANAVVLAMWDGTSGGTKNCLSYAHTRIEAVNA